MKAKDLRERSLEDLKELEKSLRKDLFQHRFKNFTNRLDNTSIIRKTHQDLARVLTLLGQHTKGTVPVGAVAGAKPKAPKAAKPAKVAAPKAEKSPKAPKAEKSDKPEPKTKKSKKTEAK
jgi:large subunit ribosomal protein L29